MIYPDVLNLARFSLEDSPLFSEANVAKLAQRLQDTLDDTVAEFIDDAKARDEARYADHIDRQIDRMRDGDL
jgi:macrodomain Ter protein organizer (MatP/YcbG family)